MCISLVTIAGPLARWYGGTGEMGDSCHWTNGEALGLPLFLDGNPRCRPLIETCGAAPGVSPDRACLVVGRSQPPPVAEIQRGGEAMPRMTVGVDAGEGSH